VTTPPPRALGFKIVTPGRSFLTYLLGRNVEKAQFEARSNGIVKSGIKRLKILLQTGINPLFCLIEVLTDQSRQLCMGELG
jgi:hypothetical protein